MRQNGFPVVALLVLGACAIPERPVTEWPLNTGQTIQDLLPGSGPAAVLVYDPADCFTCSSSIAEWMAWESHYPGRVLMVFTREPTPAERKRLVLHRITADGILGEPLARLSASSETPVEFAILDGRTVQYGRLHPRILTEPGRRAPPERNHLRVTPTESS